MRSKVVCVVWRQTDVSEEHKYQLLYLQKETKQERSNMEAASGDRLEFLFQPLEVQAMCSHETSFS
jgi:hypothetical protein